MSEFDPTSKYNTYQLQYVRQLHSITFYNCFYLALCKSSNIITVIMNMFVVLK